MVLTGYYLGEITHTCTPQNEKTWGCKHELKKPIWNLPCWLCIGRPGNSECEACGGFGMVGMNRCPNSVNTGTLDKVFSFYSIFCNHHALPVEGGLLDQTTSFNSILRVAPSFEQAWRDLRERKEKAKADAKKNSGGNNV